MVERAAFEKAAAHLFPDESEQMRALIVQGRYAGTLNWWIRSHRVISADWQEGTSISIKPDGEDGITIDSQTFYRFCELRLSNSCIVHLRRDVYDRISEVAAAINADQEQFAEYQRLKAIYDAEVV